MGQDLGRSEAVSFPYEEYDQLGVKLGDLLRGERATRGKSLLDVERELKIKASYIAAIENADLDAFQSPGFIAGYVRSYARYLGLDPEWTFERFSVESGFNGVHSMSARQASQAKRSLREAPRRVDPNDVIAAARVSFTPEKESVFSRVEPGALGSIAVLLAVVAGIGYGAWAVFHDIQRLEFAPVEEAPDTLAVLDPVEGATGFGAAETEEIATALPATDGFDRLYRPQALDVPVLTPRDGPLATLDPDRVGALAPSEPMLPGFSALASAEPAEVPGADVQVTERVEDEVMIFAVRPSWVRVTSASGTVIFETTLNAGESFTLPASEEPPTLRAGNSGSLYFAVNGVTLGPAGPGTSVARDVVLSADAITESYTIADAAADPELAEVAALVLGTGDEDAASE